MDVLKNVLTCVIMLVGLTIQAQSLTQTVRGSVVDIDNQLPLIGVTVVVVDSDPLIGTTTDVDGRYILPDILIGRVDLSFSSLGYQAKVYDNIVVRSAKETIIDVSLKESIVKLHEIEISARKNAEGLDEMTLSGIRTLSPEETNRYAGGFNDPSRVASNFAGVTNTADGGNDIIVKGNSPKYVQWRLEGMQITNPNHFGDQSGAGGSISALNNNMLSQSDFMTGAFSSEYGNVLSAVYDIKFRNGNSEKHEAIIGVGLLGLDLTLEGPLKKGYAGSYLVNYRYSTASIATDLGLIDTGGVPKFQDGAFKILLPTQRVGIFSIYGLVGYSSFLWENVNPSTWVTPGDNFMRDDITEDYSKNANLFNTGINHTLSLGENSYLRTNLGFSSESINDHIIENVTDVDSTMIIRDNFKGKLTRSSYQGSIIYNHKLTSRHKIQVGTRYSSQYYNIAQSQLSNNMSNRVTLISMDENIDQWGSFVNWKFNANRSFQFVTGLHKNMVLYNNKISIEPRLAISYNINMKSAISLGLGKHSTMESIHNYFAQVPTRDNIITTPNTDLELLKANHITLSYDHHLKNDLSAKIELYYQDLYDIPVENLDTSYYSTINEGLEFRYVDLVNEGTGKNYGVELTLEKSLNNNYYYLFNSSLFQSKYTALDGIVRNTQYNNNYLINFLIGKEFPSVGKSKNHTLAVNLKVFLSGGKKYIPLLRDSEDRVAVDQDAGKFYDYSQAYNNDLDDISRIIISTSYKWNKSKSTHELFLNLDNVTNSVSRLGEYYDSDEESSIGYYKSFGFFPNLVYRVYL